MLVLTVFAGCGGSSKKSPSDSAAASSGNSSTSGGSGDPDDPSQFDPAADEPAYTVDFGKGNYNIIRPADDKDAAVTLYKYLKDTAKLKISVSTDDTERGADAKEIIVGNTSRPESKKAKDILKMKANSTEKEYIICCINENIVICGMSPEALKEAVSYFIDNYCKNCNIQSNERYINRDDAAYKPLKIGEIDIGKYYLVVPNYNESFITIRRVEELAAAIKKQTGCVIDVIFDNIDPYAYEIVVGACARDGVKKYEDNDYDSYSVRYENNKLYINGGRNYATALAVQLITESVNKGRGISTNTVESSYTEADDTGDYHLKWTDEFEFIDNNKWAIVNETQDYYGSWYGMKTARSSKPENLRAEDGKLYVTATFDDTTFYGAYLSTKNSLKFVGGYMEMRAKLADGDGIWFDFWTWNDDQEHVELDMMECWSGGDYYVNYLHEFNVVNGVRKDAARADAYIYRDKVVKDFKEFKSGYVYNREKSMNNEFHTFGCEWGDSDIVWYRDGKETLRYTFGGTPNEYLYKYQSYFILSMLVGSNQHNYNEEQGRDAVIKNPLIDGEYWSDGRNVWTIEYVQLFQKEGQVFNLLKK